MRLPTVPTNAVVEHLNTTYFNQVWNAPDANKRSNFELHKAAERLQTGAVSVAMSVVGLPTTDAVYAVYRTLYRGFSRFTDIPSNRWMSDTELASLTGASAVAYAASGRVIPPGVVFFRYIPDNNMVLVAISRTYTDKCLGDAFPPLYMTVFKDTTRLTPTISRLFVVTIPGMGDAPGSAVSSYIAQQKLTSPKSTVVSINGLVYDLDHLPTLVVGDVVHVLTDPDVVGYCDITVDDNMTGYYSEKYGEYREILHIPKALNPNNIILTYDTITAVVLDKDTRRGVLGHRVDEDSVESITHNDFSMSRSALNAYANTLGANEVIVRLYVRFSNDPNYLTDDINHISDLYTLSDAEISQQMLGLASPQIPEWRAGHLESSEFLSLLYKFEVFSNDTAIGKFVDAVGYHDVASVLGQQIRAYTYKGGAVKVSKPARLHNLDCQIIAYANGRKIPEVGIMMSDFGSRYFTLGFKPSGGVSVGDRIVVYILEGGYRSAIVYKPTTPTPQIVLDNEDYTLYEVVPYNEPQKVWKTSVTKGYRHIPLGSADYTVTPTPLGKYAYQVRSKHFNKTLYLIPKFGLNTARYDLTSKVNDVAPISIDLLTSDLDGNIIPMLGYETMEVYVNGHRLIAGLDYVCNPIFGEREDVLQNLLVISSSDYFNLDGGKTLLEVCVHGDKVTSQDKGYVIDQIAHRTSSPMIWSKASGRMFVGGVLVEEISQIANVITIHDHVDNGRPFLLQQMQAFGVSKLMSGISPSPDNNLQTRIENLFGLVAPTYPELVSVAHLHALFSPFLAQIVTDVGNRVIKIIDESTDERFVKQFLPYKAILERDPIVGTYNSLIDHRFVTLAAHYGNYGVSDPNQMLLIQRLINRTLTPSGLSIKEVLL